jgi:hypothetical protein
MKKTIVLWDHAGTYLEGDLIEHPTHARVAECRGAALLPVETDLLKRHAVGGYMRRGHGQGLVLSAHAHAMFSSMALFVVKTQGRVHWAARLKSTGGTPSGIMRLVSDGTQTLVQSGGLGPSTTNLVELKDLGAPDKDGGWNIGGSCPIHVMAEGMMSLALYGSGQGVALEWSAVTQAD